MKLTTTFTILATATFSLSTVSMAADPIKVACVGDSITFGLGLKDRNKDSYPAQLQKLLGEKYEVRNYGVSARTMLKKGDTPWVNHPNFKRSTDYQPNVVVIKLGTNDSKPRNWKFKAEFKQDTIDLINHFQALPSKPRIILCTPVPALTPATTAPRNISGPVVADEIVPLTREAADSTEAELVDLYSEFNHHGGRLKSILPDKVHPNEQGAAHIALRVADQILVTRNKDYSVEAQLKKAKIESKKSTFKGYTRFTFNYSKADNAQCVIVAPKTAIAGQPWIWRARFFGHQPALDLALLERGYHVCYCDIANLFGSPTAVKRWDKFYKLTQKLDLSKKPILEGMSRGGLIIFNWAKENPEKVAAIYGDNPVCDIRSWPAKKNLNTWKTCLKAWDKKESAMPTFKGNPIDKLDKLAKANVPVFLVLGKKDKVVPLAENSYILSDRYTKLNGSVTIWEKPNGKHHPHGLNPIYPLLRHLLHATGNPLSPQLYQRAGTQTLPVADDEAKKK